MESNQSVILTDIQNILDKALDKGKEIKEEDLAFFQAIKQIIDIKLNEQEIQDLFKDYQDFIYAMIEGNFSKRLDIENTKDLFSFLTTSLNVLAEELEDRVMPTELYNISTGIIMKFKPDLALLTTSSGKIKYVSHNPESLIEYSQKQLINKRIQNFLSDKVSFGVMSNPGQDLQDIILINSDQVKIPALMSQQEIILENHIYPYYLYLIKEKEDV